MSEARFEEYLRSVISSQLGARKVSLLPLDREVADIGANIGQLCHQLGITPEKPKELTITTLSKAIGESGTGGALERQALKARVQRIAGAMLVTTQVVQTESDVSTWWNELVTQIVWWHCAEEVEGGKALVQGDIPAEVSAVLIKTGLSDPETLSFGSGDDRDLMTNILQRFGIDLRTAEAIYEELSAIARGLWRDNEDNLLKTLRNHANQIADALTSEIAEGVPDTGVLKRALRAWLAVMTRLPVSVWSPSTMDFVNKFAHLGLNEATLEEIAAQANIDHVGLDRALSQFSEDLCLTCDPGNPSHQYCIRKFAEIGWEVECVDPANTVDVS